ncbi:MAG: M4 family metallopeptidase [Kofleriaceae bacterium]
MRARNLSALVVALAVPTITSCTAPGGELSESSQLSQLSSASDGLPYLLAGDLGRATAPIDSADSARAALSGVLPAIAAQFQVAPDDLIATRVQHDRFGMTHVRFAQHKHGLRVVGGDLVVHLLTDGTVRSVTGTARDGITLPSTASIAENDAAEIARQATANGRSDVHRSELTYVITTGDGSMHLAWEILAIGREELVADLVYVDALTGKVVDRRPRVFTARNRLVFDNGGEPFSILSEGVQMRSETDPATSDDIVNAAFDNTGLTYDCYKTLYGRDSYDNAGAVLRSIVHATFPIPGGGSTGNNAAWISLPFEGFEPKMVYGDGDNDFMTPLAHGFDVTVHELTHGVVSETAELAYMGESGALNEGMADIMAAVCEAWHDGGVSADTWKVGEDIFTPATSGDALRYMNNPTLDEAMYPPELGGSRDFYPERYNGQDDNGGVHLNSGIPNLAFQLLVSGGTHPRNKTSVMVPGIGIQKAGAIFQQAMTQGYFTMNTNFAQARAATEEVASMLYPGQAKTAVSLAWAAVGVGTAPVIDDSTPPQVEITSPDDGTFVGEGFAVEVDASDDKGVLSVDLMIDGEIIGTDTSAPYTFTIPGTLEAGSHTIEAVAFDQINSASDSITVMMATTCVADSECGDGEVCDDGLCKDEDVAGADGNGGGCGCATGTDGKSAAGTLLLLLGTALMIGRRRPRRS